MKTLPDSDDQSGVIAFLADPATHAGNAVTHFETHASHVFLAGDRAFKLKRAVRYPYLDYSSATSRRKFCFAELRANRRFAGDLYLAVLPVVQHAGRFSFGDENTDGIVDWVVVMQRFPQSALLDEMRKEGSLSIPLMRTLGSALADIHDKAEVDRGRGGRAAMSAVVAGNAARLRSFIGRPFDGEVVDQFDAACEVSLLNNERVLDRRRADGFVRRCHGDLHLNNICMWKGKPTPFDSIEFDESLCVIDVLYDLSFLLMDLEHHRLGTEANAVLNSYLWRAGEFTGLEVLPLFMACRAAIRAHVTATAAESKVDEPVWRFSLEANRLLDCALNFLQPGDAKLIAVGGVSGTGKSTLAHNLAPFVGHCPGAVVLRSDLIRKRMFGVPDMDALPAAAYSPSVSVRVYDVLAELAGTVLNSGHSVIADAVFGSDPERQMLEHLAHRMKAKFQGIWLQAGIPTCERRIADRRDDASDATVDVLHSQLGTIAPPSRWAQLASDGEPGQVLQSAKRVLQN